MTLELVLKKKWFDMIASGEKLEEYREINPHWIRRIMNPKLLTDFHVKEEDWARQVGGLDADVFRLIRHRYTEVHFAHGYQAFRPEMNFIISDIAITTGNPAWGAEPGKKYFVIKLGKRI